MSGHLDQPEVIAEALAAAERTALATLADLGPGCRQSKILTGSTKRGPAFVFACTDCRTVTLVSVPVGGLRNRALDDPTSRTRLSTFALARVVLETGAYIESDGAVRARFVLHLPGRDEPEWDIQCDRATAVGEAVAALRRQVTRTANHPADQAVITT